MRKTLTLICMALPMILFAQTEIKEGDFVFVKKTTTHYSTGESISSWVYGEPHQVSQIDSKYHPDGILLNVRGAKSWLNKSDVLLCVPQGEIAQPQVIREEPKVSPATSTTQVVNGEPIIIHDTITNYVEKIKEIVKVDTVTRIDTIERVRSQKTYLQLDAAPQITCGKENLGMGAHLTVGARVSDYYFIGFGFGVEGSLVSFKDYSSVYTMQIPMYANMRCYFPIRDVYPFLDGAAGLNVRELNFNHKIDKEWVCGLYARAGIGVEWKRLIVGAGYQFTGGRNAIDDNVHQAYIKCGIRFVNRD